MKKEDLQELIKLESEIMLDLIYVDINISENDITKAKKKFQKEMRNVQGRLRTITKNTRLKIVTSRPRFITEFAETMAGNKRYFMTCEVEYKFFHKITSKYDKTLIYQKENSTLKITYAIASRDTEEDQWKISIYIVDNTTSLNNAFITFIRYSECNAVIYIKYDNLEFVYYKEDFYYFTIFHQCEGEIDYLILKNPVSDVKVSNDMDCITTDCAMTFTIT